MEISTQSGKPTAHIATITFSSGKVIELGRHDKVIIVGPNNCGKSQSLRDILALTAKPGLREAITVVSVSIAKSGTPRDLKKFLDENAELFGESYRYKDWSINQAFIPRWTENNLPNGLSGGYIKLINADSRLGICAQQNSVRPDQQKEKPQHLLYFDPDLMARVSQLFKKAFAKDLLINYLGGSVIPIHVGDAPSTKNPDRVSKAYVDEVVKNPLLHNQGDGVKSYAGILFETIVSEREITLLDEPEAFLHPPQMRRLGDTLASELKKQLIVATHSSDILRGFLEATRGNVRILRLQRVADANVVCEASPETIRELWSAPKLRYSSALEGIFHEETIICEDDSDCRLYQAIAEYNSTKNPGNFFDTHYVPAGGKSGVARVASVLRKIGVPVKTILDIDILSDKSVLRECITSFGGDWDQIGAIWERLNSAVTSGVRPKSASEIRQEISELIDGSSGEELPRGKIMDAMKQSSSWGIVKRAGKLGIPRGDAQIVFRELADFLAEIGIYVVEAGEVENFFPDIGNHGPKFVNQLLEEVSLDDPRLQALRDFVVKVQTGKSCSAPT